MKITQDQWQRFFKNEDSEERVVAAIENHLLSEQQEIWLRNNSLTVQDLLNGRYYLEQEAKVHAMFEAWNVEIGMRHFYTDCTFADIDESIRKNVGPYTHE